jgi:hypothetical protein
MTSMMQKAQLCKHARFPTTELPHIHTAPHHVHMRLASSATVQASRACVQTLDLGGNPLAGKLPGATHTFREIWQPHPAALTEGLSAEEERAAAQQRLMAALLAALPRAEAELIREQHEATAQRGLAVQLDVAADIADAAFLSSAVAQAEQVLSTLCTEHLVNFSHACSFRRGSRCHQKSAPSAPP